MYVVRGSGWDCGVCVMIVLWHISHSVMHFALLNVVTCYSCNFMYRNSSYMCYTVCVFMCVCMAAY